MMANLQNHWPTIQFAISIGVFGVGVVLGAAGQAIGDVNLPMVLAFCGSSLIIISSWSVYINSVKVEKIGEVLVFALFIAGATIGLGYAGVHFGIAPLLPSSLSVPESIGAQAGIGFGVGFVPLFVISSLYGAIRGQSYATYLPDSLKFSFITGILISASAALGPALVASMGSATINATQALALETLISVGLASSAAWMAYCMLEIMLYTRKTVCGNPRAD